MTDTIPLENLITVITEKLKHDPVALKGVTTVGQTIQKTGMALEDCLLLARISTEKYESLCNDVPEVPVYFRLKRIQYKEKLLEVLNVQATQNNDVKIAMYLLEANFTEEYNASAKKDSLKKKAKTSENDLEKLMDRVRQSAGMPIDESFTVSEQQKQDEKDTYELAHLVNAG